MIIPLCAAALMLSGVGVCLLAADHNKQQEKRLQAGETADKSSSGSWLTKKLIIFGSLMTLLCVGIAVSLSLLNTSPSLLFAFKRVCILSLLWPAAYIDYHTYRIPNSFIVAGLTYRFVILAFELVFESEGIWLRLGAELLAAVGLALAAFLCGLLIKNSVGFGDIKLFVVMGLLLGLDGIWSAIFVSLLISFVVSAVLLSTRKKKRKDVIPFAPALMIGTYISVFLTGM